MMSSLRGVRPDRAFGPVRLFFFLITVFPSISLAEVSAVPGASAIPDAWVRLLHYRKDFFGNWSNESAPAFFLTHGGDSDPDAELSASVEELSRPDSDFHCKFPARALLLSRLHLAVLPKKPCEEWTAFRDRLSATGASVVFSGYYLNNPASAFGHSFLRIHRARSARESGTPTELLDTGIGYAATVTTSNPVSYAFYGMLGLFRGEYTAMPYYYKIREYADAENRDLWSYPLALSPSELELLVAHLWELDRAELRYYYFSRNCSYEILAALEAILDSSRGRIGLLDRMPWFVIPSHTLQSLMQEPNLVSGVEYRPSQRKKLEARLSLLSPPDRTMAESWNTTESTPEMGAPVLDARMDWIDFAHFKDLIQNADAPQALKQQTLRARALTGVVQDDQKEQVARTEPDPSQGHRPRRVQLGVGHDPERLFTQLSFRPALQDLLDPAAGYPESAQIEFVNVSVRASDRLRLQRLGLFQVQSLSSWTRVKYDPSWKVGVVYEADSGTRLDVAGGATVPVPGARLFLLGGGRLLSPRWFALRPHGTLELGIHSRIGESFAFLGSVLKTISRAGLGSEISLEGRWHITQNLGWGAGFVDQTGAKTWQSGVTYFF